MKPDMELKTTAEYIAVLRPLLPSQAFVPSAWHLWRIALHLAVIAFGYALLFLIDSWWAGLPVSLLIGHSLGCLLFLAHDLSHSSIVRNLPVRRSLELLLWGLNFIPPTLWRRIHNQTHHVETNTVHDTDRAYRVSEKTAAIWAYNRMFFPNRRTPFRHPLVLVHFVTYVVRQLVTALLPGTLKPSIVTAKPHYSARQKIAIVVELLFIGALQLGVWHLLGADARRYALAVLLPVCVASAVTMSYIWTNHILNPLCEHTDLLVGSTSVIVPHWADWLHDNFSYHTEHHVFPAMNPRYYPAVSRLLQQHFPDRYNRVAFDEAWRRIWQQEEFIREERPPS